MKNYTKILAAVDLSELSESILESADAVSKRNNAQLLVLNVVDYAWQNAIDYVQPSGDEVEAKLVSAAQERLDSVLNRVGVTPQEKLVVTGAPKQEILRVAEQKEADLIIIGAHGYHGLKDILGSTADRVIHRAGRDVLIIHR